MQDVSMFYPSSAVYECMTVEKKLDHVGTSPLAGHVQWTNGVLQHCNTSVSQCLSPHSRVWVHRISWI